MSATSAQRRTTRRRAVRAVPGLVLGFVLVLGACGEIDDAETTPQEYLEDLEAICADTTAALDALPEPPEQISVTEFAVDAASLLTSEAEQARQLDVPDDLDDDHRAFVRNTDEQAAAWRAIADGAAADTTSDTTSAADGTSADLVDLTTRIGELTLGRDDLVAEMGAPECRRGDRPS